MLLIHVSPKLGVSFLYMCLCYFLKMYILYTFASSNCTSNTKSLLVTLLKWLPLQYSQWNAFCSFFHLPGLPLCSRAGESEGSVYAGQQEEGSVTVFFFSKRVTFWLSLNWSNSSASLLTAATHPPFFLLASCYSLPCQPNAHLLRDPLLSAKSRTQSL